MRGSRRPLHLRLLWRLSLLLLLLLCTVLPACSLDGLGGGGVGDSKTLALVTIFPTTGPDAAIGLALHEHVVPTARHSIRASGLIRAPPPRSTWWRGPVP